MLRPQGVCAPRLRGWGSFRVTALGFLVLAGLLLSLGRPAHAQMLTGSYTGDGTDNRQITGLGFQPDVVTIKGNATQNAVMRTSTMAGDNSKALVGGTGLEANLIQSLDPGGFTIANDARVNSSGLPTAG